MDITADQHEQLTASGTEAIDTSLKLVSINENVAIFGGYGVIFNTADLEGDIFTAETDYRLAKAVGADVYIDHTLDTYVEGEGQVFKLKGIDDPIGEIVEISPDDTGLYMQLMIDKTSQYWELVDFMVNNGRYKCGLSTGSTAHLVRRDGGVIKKWPINEISLTMTPAEPKTTNHVTQLKNTDETGEPEAQPETAGSAVELAQREAVTDVIDETPEETPEPIIEVIETMTVETEAPEAVDAQRVEALEEGQKQLSNGMKGLSDNVALILEKLNQNSRLKDLGYIAPDSEEDRPETKSLADFLMAVRRGNTKRLARVYKAMEEGDGSEGGFLVPSEFLPRLMQLASTHGVVRQRTTPLRVNNLQGEIPALDQTLTPTAGAGQTAFAGGVRSYWTGEEASITETTPNFNMIEYKINKLAGFTAVSKELMRDSAIGIEDLLSALFGRAVAANEDYAFFNGSGVGQPLGILNSSAAVSGGANTGAFTIDDAVDMLSHFQPAGGDPVWVMHRSQIVDLSTGFNVDVGGTDLIQPRERIPQTILGYPVVYSEFLPAKGNTGSTILADFSAYMIFDHGGLMIEYSDHAKFLTDQGTWKFTKRLDGQPWLEDAVTLNGSHDVSPFVKLLD